MLFKIQPMLGMDGEGCTNGFIYFILFISNNIYLALWSSADYQALACIMYVDILSAGGGFFHAFSNSY